MRLVDDSMVREASALYSRCGSVLTFKGRDGSIETAISTDGLCMVVRGEIPQSALAECIGRPIGDVVQRSGLNKDAVITRAEARNGLSGFWLATSVVNLPDMGL